MMIENPFFCSNHEGLLMFVQEFCLWVLFIKKMFFVHWGSQSIGAANGWCLWETMRYGDAKPLAVC